ncbi:hypothetical protein [Nonomuraea jiangxiensis]|nr:hypothetical protein [Nonomuraea jiangxiensis]
MTVNDHLRAVTTPVPRDLDRREADTLLRSYLEPACFPDAVDRLARRHLLVLVSEGETGRRLGGIALLSRMSLAESRITVLSPAGTARELSGTDYGPGRAYLLHDWIAASTDRTELVGLARKLAELGSYLVITRSGALSQAVEVEQPWTAPDPGELFDLCVSTFDLRAGRSPDEITRARDLALTLRTPAEVVRLAGQEAPARDEVAAWFDTKPSMRDVLAVAALAFAPGAGFEARLAELERLCPETGLRPPRGPLANASGTGFLAPHYRDQVLEELVGRYGFWLWQPLRDWVRWLAGQGPETVVRAAQGVASLAAHSFKEARQEFLDVWARGTDEERMAAAHVLSYMCADDTLAPEALRLALAWAADPATATTAAVALGGGLSVRYPADTSRHLRRLAAGEGPAAAVARQGLTLPADRPAAQVITALPQR